MLRLKGCPRCGGDLRPYEGDWQCLQCGHYYYGELPLRAAPSREPSLDPARVLPVRETAGIVWHRSAPHTTRVRADASKLPAATSTRARADRRKRRSASQVPPGKEAA